MTAYTRGLHRLTDDTYAYLRPPGTWGFSNCGLVVDGDQGLLVDTQFDLPMTRELLAAIDPAITVGTIVITHANGDHCWGNQLLPDAEVIATEALAHELPHEIQPAQLAALSGPGSPATPLGDYMRRHFGGFDFGGITVRPPTRTFSGSLTVPVRGRAVPDEPRPAAGSGRAVQVEEVGPAHTEGDVIVHVPDAGVVFAGDILFIGGHPIMWTGPLSNWIGACDRILATGAEIIVPGHGPVTDRAGVTTFRGYLEWVAERSADAYAQGLTYAQAAAVDLPEAYAGWGNPERLVITMAAAYRGLGAPPQDLMEILAHTAAAEPSQ